MPSTYNSVELDGVTLMDISDTTAVAADVAQGKYFYDAEGVKTAGTGGSSQTQTKSVTPSETAQTVTPDSGYLLSQVNVGAISSTYVGSGVTKKAAATYYPSTSNQTIAASQYLNGAQTIAGVAVSSNLTAENIKSGTTITIGDSANPSRIMSILGTYTGGGGGIGTLLNTTSMGTQSTSSTTAADTGVSLSVSGINNYDLLIVEASVNTVTNNRHTATVGLIFLTAGTTVGTKNGATIATVKWNSKISSSAVTSTRAGTTAYGIYPNSCTVSNGTATIPMYRRYNSTSTGTINGSYTARVYGVNLFDLIGG